jgi:hypothetical protein
MTRLIKYSAQFRVVGKIEETESRAKVNFHQFLKVSALMELFKQKITSYWL